MKVSVIYHSVTHNTKTMAQEIVTGMQTVDGIKAKAFPIDAVDIAFAKESCALVFGAPVYAANMSGAMYTYLQGEVNKTAPAGKLVGAFATQDYVHGGADLTINTILARLMVSGALAYSGGGAYGKPVIHLGPVAIGGALDDSAETFRIYGARMAQKAAELFGPSK